VNSYCPCRYGRLSQIRFGGKPGLVSLRRFHVTTLSDAQKRRK
jgi:hypothetical protein